MTFELWLYTTEGMEIHNLALANHRDSDVWIRLSMKKAFEAGQKQ